jgi:hypothetical protein
MTFIRLFCCLAIAIVLSGTTRADVTFTKNSGEGGDMEVIKLTVTPAAEPVPALKHRLVGRDMEQKPGNSAPYYYRAMLELRLTMKSMREKYDEEKELSLWYDSDAEATPIDKLPLEKVREAYRMFDPIYASNLKPAFERSECDWQINAEEMRGPELISFHLEEFNTSREISRMLSLRTRLAIAERRYGDAIETMRQNYQLGRDVAKGPFIVCGLIGIAIDSRTNSNLLELIGQPDSPNLFWALGELPQPPIDLRPAVRFEMDFGPRVFPLIHNAETTDHSPQEWNRLFTKTIEDLRLMGLLLPLGTADSNKSDPATGVVATVVGLAGYTHAKEQLIASGMDRERVEKMAVGQVIAIYSERNYRRIADDWENLWQVPFAQSAKAASRLEKKLQEARPFGEGASRELLPMAHLLIPALQASRQAQMRLDRAVASIRVIEAIRLYAAGHDGTLPARLEDIDQVPVPNNPATGRPFMYWVEGKTANLQLPPADGLSGGNCRYEIQIATQK